MDTCTVILDRDILFDPRPLALVFAPVWGVSPLDARLRLRRTRGIVAGGLVKEAAESAVRTLADQGVTAREVDESTLPAFDPPSDVLEIAADGDGLIYRCGDDTSGALMWEDLAVANVGVVSIDPIGVMAAEEVARALPPLEAIGAEDRRVVGENLVLRAEERPEVTGLRGDIPLLDAIIDRFRDRVRVHMDLVGSSGSPWLRCDPRHTRVGALGDATGIRRLLEEIRRRAPAALTGNALNLMDGADIRNLFFFGATAFIENTKWNRIKHIQ